MPKYQHYADYLYIMIKQVKYDAVFIFLPVW